MGEKDEGWYYAKSGLGKEGKEHSRNGSSRYEGWKVCCSIHTKESFKGTWCQQLHGEVSNKARDKYRLDLKWHVQHGKKHDI